MNIHYERRADRPDSEGHCAIHLRLIFDGQRLRVATRERCKAADWNEKSNWFRKSFADLENATTRLQTLRNRIETTYSNLRTKHGPVTAAQLKAALAVVDAPTASTSCSVGAAAVWAGLWFVVSSILFVVAYIWLGLSVLSVQMYGKAWQ